MKILITLSLLVSLPAISSSELECYKNFHSKIEEADTAIISGYKALFDTEETLLDQYFNPENYYRGPHVPYKAQVKSTLLSKRERMKSLLEEAIEESQSLSSELSTCLKYSK